MGLDSAVKPFGAAELVPFGDSPNTPEPGASRVLAPGRPRGCLCYKDRIMTLAPLSPSPVDDLTRRIDEAVAAGDPKTICGLVKHALQDFTANEGVVDESMMETVAEGYGRRLLHRDPAGRYAFRPPFTFRGSRAAGCRPRYQSHSETGHGHF